MSHALGWINQGGGYAAYRGIVSDEESALRYGGKPSSNGVVHVFQLVMISLIFITVLSWIDVLFPSEAEVSPERRHKALITALSLTGIMFVLGFILNLMGLVKIVP